MSEQQKCKTKNKPKEEEMPKPENHIKHVIAVMSGKGGVGKSSVSGLLAISLAKEGNKVGVMDADVTGPSIPKLFGVSGNPKMSPTGPLPPKTENDISIMSFNLLLPNDDDPVIWRGPLIANAIQQFWTDINWGDLDYLVVDLPPGTGDVPLTVMQSIPLDGIVIVTSPQDLANMVVRKAVKMANKLDVKVYGLIENMSYFECPDCGKRLNIFGKSNIEETQKMGLSLLATLPLDQDFAEACDRGEIEKYNGKIMDEFKTATEKIISAAK
jgi:Mrp family chromosome partitioning ATPase